VVERPVAHSSGMPCQCHGVPCSFHVTRKSNQNMAIRATLCKYKLSTLLQIIPPSSIPHTSSYYRKSLPFSRQVLSTKHLRYSCPVTIHLQVPHRSNLAILSNNLQGAKDGEEHHHNSNNGVRLLQASIFRLQDHHRKDTTNLRLCSQGTSNLLYKASNSHHFNSSHLDRPHLNSNILKAQCHRQATVMTPSKATPTRMLMRL